MNVARESNIFETPERKNLCHTHAMRTIRKILCPVDFSAASRDALQFAADLARQTRAELVVLHVLGETPLLSAYSGLPETTSVAGAEAAAKKELEGLLAGELLADLTARAKVASASSAGGAIDRAILEQATAEGADLIVMGKHGRSALDYLFFGSVTDRVTRRATCPVVVVPAAPQP